MTRLDGDTLVPAALDQLPAIAADFFSFDRFQLLWRDVSRDNSSWLAPKPTGSFLGIRNLKGTISSGRSCTINLAFWAPAAEMTALHRIGLAIVGDFDTFRSMLLHWFSIGGPCSYQLNCTAFSDWLHSCAGMNHLLPAPGQEQAAMKLLPYLRRPDPARTEAGMLRLAVCTCGWKEIYKTLGHKWIRFRKPPNVLTPEEFHAVFIDHSPLWILETKP